LQKIVFRKPSVTIFYPNYKNCPCSTPANQSKFGKRAVPCPGLAFASMFPVNGRMASQWPRRRFTGISWHPLGQTTGAVRFKPYCTGAVTPPGKRAPISSWQWEHARQWTMWSTTTRGDGVGRSWTWRVSTLADIPSSSVWPQWLQLEGKWFTTWSGLSERNSVPLQPFWPPGFRPFTLERLCAGASPGHRLTGAFCCSGQDVVQGRISPRPAWPWSASSSFIPASLATSFWT